MNAIEKADLDDAKRDAKDWRDFAVFWFVMAVIGMGAFFFEVARHAK